MAPDKGPQAGSATALGSLHSLSVPIDWAGPVGRSPAGHSHSVGAGGSALPDQSGARTGAQILLSLENFWGFLRSRAAMLRFLQKRTAPGFLGLSAIYQISSVGVLHHDGENADGGNRQCTVLYSVQIKTFLISFISYSDYLFYQSK